MDKIVPGYAFSFAHDLGLSVGLITHQIPRIGDLAWIAQPLFDSGVDSATVGSIDQWRWPILLPVGPLVRRKVLSPVGIIEIPKMLRELPLMRSGNKRSGWREVELSITGTSGPKDATRDSSLPIYRVVNDLRLKEMLSTNWVPSDEW